MTPQITTLDPVTTPIHVKTILSKNGFTCSLLELEAGNETPWREAHEVEDHVIYLVAGEATVRFGDVNTILDRDEALLIPKGRAHAIAAAASGPARILRVEVPPRQIVTPQILSFDR
jgi:mannose-6-phosphate isomerase-like protein (cupin superfamily)